jgi:hypothetical protein
MNQKMLYWVKTTLTNDENSDDEEIRAYFIEGGLTETEADEWIAKRTFYRNNIVVEDDEHNDIGIYDRIPAASDRFPLPYTERESSDRL